MKRRVACLIADGFVLDEIAAPQTLLALAGFEIHWIGLEKGLTLVGKNPDHKATVQASIENVSVNDYAALWIPSAGEPHPYAHQQGMLDFVRDFDSSKKALTATGNGLELLLEASKVDKRKVAADKALGAFFEQKGAQVSSKKAWVSDGNWLTSRSKEQCTAFAEAFVLQLDTNADQSWMARGDVHVQS